MPEVFNKLYRMGAINIIQCDVAEKKLEAIRFERELDSFKKPLFRPEFDR